MRNKVPYTTDQSRNRAAKFS